MTDPTTRRAEAVRRAASEAGATAAEYVFLLVFIALIASVGMVALGDGLDNVFQTTGDSVNTTPVGTPGGGGGTTN